MKNWILLLFILFLTACNRNEKKLFIVAGQSNAMGVGDSTQSVFENSNNYEYNSKFDSFVPLKDPVGQNHLGFQVAKTGSFIPSFAHHYTEITENAVYIVQWAKGGSALNKKAETNNWGNWSQDGKLLKNSFRKIDSAISKAGVQPAGIIWAQGENDGSAIGKGILTDEEYEQSLKELISHYEKKYGKHIPFIIIETGRHTSCEKCDAGFEVVRKLQKKVAENDENIYIGYDETDEFIKRNWLKDPVHYNQKALNHIGKKLAIFISEKID